MFSGQLCLYEMFMLTIQFPIELVYFTLNSRLAFFLGLFRSFQKFQSLVLPTQQLQQDLLAPILCSKHSCI